MEQLENGTQTARAASNPQAQPLQIPEFPPASSDEGKDATIHDFLSLGGSKNLSSTASQGVTVTTQDLLQPLENNRMPSSSSGLLPHGLAMGAVRTHSASVEYAGQPASYAVVNGSMDLPSNARYKTIPEGLTEGMKERFENLAHWSGIPSKYRPSDLGYAGKAHLPQALPPAVNKRWHHQQQASAEALDAIRKASKVTSEEDEDEDDELFDHAYSSKKEVFYPKSDASHKLEGKTNDSKATTPRSKHSATEQRRRSKINDRFQMLRQLLPNVDQKRDKASFLLEVIEYIQMLQDKVNKFETAEHGRLQERTKTSQWDAMNSACRDSTANSAYLPIVSGVTIDAKEGPDSNGYIKKRSSPLRATCENEGSSSELMSGMGPGMGQVLAFQSRVSQGPQACLSSYEAANKSISLTLSSAQPLPFERISTPGFPPTESRNPGFPSIQQPVSEAHAVFDQLLKHEEQQTSALEAKGSSTSKEEGQLQANNFAVPSQRSPEQDVDLQKNDTCMLKEYRKEDSVRLAAIGEGVEAGLKKTDLQLEEQEPLVVQGGIIKISSMYSQGLLDTLTQALQSSGVDLTQATISVQIDLGKPGGGVIASSRKTISPSTSLQPPPTKESGSILKIDHTRKKLKIEMDG